MRRYLLTAAVLAGLAIFGVGFRLTDEVIVVVGLLGMTAAALGFSAAPQWWLMALGLGLGVGLSSLLPQPGYHPDARHLALYGPPQPLPLPFGLTGNHVATSIAVAGILLRALAQVGRRGQATAIGVGRLYEVGWNRRKNTNTTNGKDGVGKRGLRASGPGELSARMRREPREGRDHHERQSRDADVANRASAVQEHTKNPETTESPNKALYPTGAAAE